MTITEAAIGFGSLLALAAAWQQVKGILRWALSFVLVYKQTDYSDLSKIVTAYLMHKSSRRLLLGPSTYGSDHRYVSSLKGFAEIVSRRLNGCTQLFFVGWRPIISSANWDTMTGDNGGSDPGVTFVYPRGCFDWKKLTWEATEWYREREHDRLVNTKFIGRYCVNTVVGSLRAEGKDGAKEPQSNGVAGFNAVSEKYEQEMLHWRPEDLTVAPPPCTLDKMSITPELRRLHDEVMFWLENKWFYKEKGIPWHRAYRFDGGPGTGKTSYARALAQKLDFPVFAYDLGSLDNRQFTEAWAKMQGSMPCMILIEDVDAVFHQRKNVASPRGLTFDCFLQRLDGIDVSDGALVVITTNHPEHLDDALGGRGEEVVVDGSDGEMPERPGRVDRVVHFGPLDRPGREKMAARILGEKYPGFEAMVEKGEGDTGAQFQERLFREAVKILWDKAPRREDGGQA